MIDVMVIFSPRNLPLLEIIKEDPSIRPSIFLREKDSLIKLFDEVYDVYVDEGVVEFVKRKGVKVSGLAPRGAYSLDLHEDHLRIRGKCVRDVDPLTVLRYRIGDLVDVSDINPYFDGIIWGKLPSLSVGVIHLLASRDRVKFLPKVGLSAMKALLKEACSPSLVKPIYLLKGHYFVMSPLSLGLEALDLIKECEGIPIKASRRIKLVEG